MNTDSTIRDTTYSFFLMEAPELLQAIESDLLSFREDHSKAKVHNLMRLTHTLKGAAASVGLETVKKVAHSLEDVFKSLYNPDIVIDMELETLLFQGYECLRLPLTSELSQAPVNEAQILDRAAVVFAQLQGKLGDFFDQEAQIPSSAELGFDITKSIFESGVQQRLDALATALIHSEAEKIAALLQEQASVFIGLAESLGLPGFAAIAQTTIEALQAHPEEAIAIAQTALADLQAGQVAVIGGDRRRGGEPSATLKQLAIASSELEFTDLTTIWEPIAELSVTPDAVEQQPDDEDSVLSLNQLFGSFSPTEDVANLEEVTLTPSAVSPVNPLETLDAESTPTSKSRDIRTHVRVELDKLQRLNYLSGELLTNQNRQVASDEQLQQMVQRLQQQLQQHQLILRQMRDQSDRMLTRSGRQDANRAINSSPWSRFDTLELDPYSEFDVLLQSALEDTVQLEETTGAIALFTQKSSLTLEKQQRLLTNVRDDLMTVQMMPMGAIFNRFPPLLEQLVAVHDKSVTLELVGTEVLVDKAIAEKLYDPILHLLRNAFDHGIESPALRQQHSKPETGLIRLLAQQQGRWTTIAVSDDGNGIDFEKIYDRALEMNLMLPDTSSLTETILLDLLFEPGFSTASQVSDLSGRGVGLDVVRTQLEALQGSIAIRSQPQQGTTFLLQIPFTPSVAKVLVCQAKTQVYAFLADTIEQIVLPQADTIKYWQGQRVFHWQQEATEQMVPWWKLSDLMKYTNPLPEALMPSGFKEQIGPVLLVSQGKELLGLEVDQVIGEQELVIRPVGGIIMPPSYVEGCCILADGRLTLMIDISSLLSQAQPTTQGSVKMIAAAAPSTTLTEVLVVDDSITLRQNISLVLQKAGYQVIQARDGGEAILQIQQHPTVKLIVCDIEMPGMNGFEFLSHRSQSPPLSNIPVIMLTSRSADKHRQIALELGANGYLTKPYLDWELLATVAELIEGAGNSSK